MLCVCPCSALILIKFFQQQGSLKKYLLWIGKKNKQNRRAGDLKQVGITEYITNIIKNYRIMISPNFR
jgi:hypothetical protein